MKVSSILLAILAVSVVSAFPLMGEAFAIEPVIVDNGAKITGPNTAEVVFNTQIAANGTLVANDVRFTPDNNGGDTANREFTARIAGDKVILSIRGDPLETSATGTLTGPLNVLDRNARADTATPTPEFIDAQKPVVESAKITGPNQITIVFSENVAALVQNFSDFNLSDGTVRGIGSAAGTGTDTITLTMRSPDIPTKATGTIDIKNTTGSDGTTDGVVDLAPSPGPNEFMRLNNYSVTAGQIPEIVSARITASNTIIIGFSETLESDATNGFVENFSRLVIDGDSREIDTALGAANTSTTNVDEVGAFLITLTVRGDAIPTVATGTIDIAPRFSDATPPVPISLDDTDNIPVEAVTGYEITDGQPPTLKSTYPKNTGPNEITIMFSEPVDVKRTHFDDITLDTVAREITSFTGSGSDTIILKVDGAAVDDDASAPGTMSISNKITDKAGTEFTRVGTLDSATNFYTGIDITPGQAPTVESAKVTAGKTIEIEFSTPVDGADTPANFEFYYGNSRRPILADPEPQYDSTTATVTLTIGGDPLPAAAGGKILIKAAVHNTATSVPIEEKRYDVAAGQIPIVESAKITGPNEITIVFSEPVDEATAEITADTFDDFFKGFKLTGGMDVTLGDERVLEWIDTESVSDDKATFKFTIGGSQLPTDATGTINLLGINDASTENVKLYNRDRTLNHLVTDGQNPTIDSIRITAPNTITIKSSEPINASADVFTAFTTSGSVNKNIGDINVDINSYNDTIELTISGSPLASDASGTIVITPTTDDDGKQLTLIDAAGNQAEFVASDANDTDPRVMTGTADVVAGQVPELMTGYPRITGPTEITIMFTTEVNASQTAFTDFTVDGEDNPRPVRSIQGSGSDTIILTVGGDPIDAEKVGTISISSAVTSSNSAASFVASEDVDVVAGQAPTVESAEITGPSEITIEFSDDVSLPASPENGFTSLKINSDSNTYTVSNASASGSTVILSINNGDVAATLKHDATGTIQISKEAVSNSISDVPNDIVATQIIMDGQSPQVKSAKVTDNNTVTIEFTEAVDVEIAEFDEFTIDGETVARSLTLMDGNGTDTIILQVGGNTLESNATGTIQIKRTIEDLAENTLASSTPVTSTVEAGQIPIVESAVVSSSDTITITFSEPVNADLSHFTGIVLGGTSRNAESIDGSGTDTIVLTISVTETTKLDGDITGSVTISDDITDHAGNILDVGDSTTIDADPQPKVESAKITGFNTITIEFSEPITAVPGDFTNFEIEIEGVSEPRAITIHESQLVDGTVTDADTIILLVTGDPIPLGTDGTIDIIPSVFTPADLNATPPVIIRTYGSLIDRNAQVIEFATPVPDPIPDGFVYGIENYTVEDDQSEPSDVSGTVTDSDGNTLSGAFVTINTDPEMNTVTNSAGVYMFSEIPAGIYEITAVTPRDGAITRSITVPGGEYDFALAPDSLISGTVTDTNGDGISGVTVNILGSFVTVTDDDGMYSFSESPLGAQRIYVTLPDGYERVGNFITTVTVVEGENQTVNFTFRSTAPVAPTGTVSGIVTDSATNSSISGATVFIGSLSTSTSATGSYTIANVPIGSNSISVSAAEYNTAVQTVTVNAGQNTVNISLTPVPATSNGYTIFGIITDSATSVGIQGITGTISTDPVRVFTTEFGGTFNISDVPAGTYTISAVGTNYNEGTTTVTVPAGQTIPLSLTPVVVTSTGTVSGIVTDSATNSLISGATVSIVGTSLNASTDSAGGYTILQVPVGTHSLAITSSGYTGGSGSVTVTADTTSTMNFSLTPVSMPGETNRVIGVVLDSSTGNMVSGATLTLSNNVTVTTQSSGAFQFSNVPVGSYALTVNAQGYNEYTDSDVEVDVGIPTSLRISLDPVAQPATVQVTVTDSNGSPISGATVTLDGNITTTDSNGMSTFNNVVAGTYDVDATATGYESGTARVTATAGQSSDITIALVPITQPATISGMVYNDINSNGMQDSFENVIEGAKVTLYKLDGTTVETTTDSDGMYQFTDLGTEFYTIYVSYEGDRGYAYETPKSGETITSDIGL